VIAQERPRLTLRDGSSVEVRPLAPGDRAGLAAAAARLSADSRYQRFATPKPRLTERELDFLLDVDHRAHEALLAIDPLTRRGVGVVRYVQIAGEPGVAEAAATVADDWQGRGLGSALLALLTERARAEGYAALRASTLAANQRSITMLLRGRLSGTFRCRPATRVRAPAGNDCRTRSNDVSRLGLASRSCALRRAGARSGVVR
jgi:RimJ/RimL family protein N-acetyltransferase